MTILWPNGSTVPPNFSAEGHFGWRNSSAPGASKFHRGLDMWGIGTVCSIADGTVVAVGWGAGYGWGGGYQVWIQHDGFFTRSLHLVGGSARVRVGDHVTAGQAIGTEGATGAYQVHLHLEITPGQWHARNDGQVDPKAWLYAHVGGSAGSGGGSADYDYDGLELDMSAQQDIEWIKERLGGSIKDGGSVTQEVRQLQADVEWLKNRVGGTSKTDSVTDFLRRLVKRG